MLTKKKNGFTLFELLVSISIIGILIAIASFSYSAAQKKARDARRTQDVNAIHTAAEQAYAIYGSTYPTTISTWGGMLQQVPLDPKLGIGYSFSYVVANTDYCVCAKLENASGNSNLTDCSAYVTGGSYYCMKSQQ